MYNERERHKSCKCQKDSRKTNNKIKGKKDSKDIKIIFFFNYGVNVPHENYENKIIEID